MRMNKVTREDVNLIYDTLCLNNKAFYDGLEPNSVLDIYRTICNLVREGRLEDKDTIIYYIKRFSGHKELLVFYGKDKKRQKSVYVTI